MSNLWDDRDRAEIGAAYEHMTPFDDKLFVLRLVVTESSRQIWLDDRLIGATHATTTGKLNLNVKLINGASLASTRIDQPQLTSNFLALSLEDYATDGSPQQALPLTHAGQVPLRPIKGDGFDLGKTIYRYRMTDGSGPDAPYVNGIHSYPNPLTVDPQMLTFRVPYRDYQNIYLIAWVDKDAHSVPAGTVRFYREQAGDTASTDFQIDDKAIADGRVKKLDMTTPDGRHMIIHFKQQPNMKYQLYLARFSNGRGAEPLRGFYTDNQMVTSLRPGIDMYMFLVGVDAKGVKTKPSSPFKLVTVDKFAEKYSAMHPSFSPSLVVDRVRQPALNIQAHRFAHY